MKNLSQWETRLVEAFDELYGSFVDPIEPFRDDDDTWIPLTVASGSRAAGFGTTNEQQLSEIRARCRMLALTNEFAINGHENRVSYIIGTGHRYQTLPVNSDPSAKATASMVQDWLTEFLEVNRWHARQQEIIHRQDRDGEAFLRLFHSADGITRIRFVEPEQVVTPTKKASDPSARFGIQTDPYDVENALGYYVDGVLVDASEIQHRKSNVDFNVKRGLPLFFPVWKNLRRAEKLLRNMSVVAEIQSAIAIIRKHRSGTRSSVEQFVSDRADASVTNSATGQTTNYRRYAPGTILDASASMDYEFPAMAIDAGQFVKVLQAELRATASRLVMPEFMLTSDASNANYSSTMVAEGPAVKMFERLQHQMIEDDLALIGRARDYAIRIGRLPDAARTAVKIKGIPPMLTTRDRYKEARADEILLKNGAMTPETMASRHGLEAL